MKKLRCFYAKAHVVKLAVTKMPKSGKPSELLDYEGISAKGIVGAIRNIVEQIR